MSDTQICPWCAAAVPAHITIAAQNPFCAACGRRAASFDLPEFQEPPNLPETEISGSAETGFSIIQRYPDGRVIYMDAFPPSPSPNDPHTKGPPSS